MTRKDYELIAGILANHLSLVQTMKFKPVNVVGAIAWDMADALQTTNPRFDRKRFLAACGYGDAYIEQIERERAA